MDRYTICEQYNAQIHVLHLGDTAPSPDATILLLDLPDGVVDYVLNPFVANHGAVGAIASGKEIASVKAGDSKDEFGGTSIHRLACGLLKVENIEAETRIL